MITIKSNINKFLANYRKRVANVKNVLNVFAQKLAERMSADMANEIQNLEFVWHEEYGNLSEIEVEQIDFTITQVSENSVRVSIGENLPKFKMSDGTPVNPVYFIEFGFGVEGEKNPMFNHEKHDWNYNINGHLFEWTYKDRYGEWQYSKGREGINFLYNTIYKYRDGWKQYLKELMENANA